MNILGECHVCGYPLAANSEGESLTCPMCSAVNVATITQGVTIPTWLLAGAVGLLIGVIAGPAIGAGIPSGQRYLEKKATW